MLLALVSPVSAVAALEDCALPTITFTSPAPLATDVPLDAVPAGLIDPGGCGTTEWTVTLTDAGTGAVVASATQDLSEGWLIEADPGEDLSPDTTYTLRFEPGAGGGEPVEVGFTTGTSHAAGLTGTPTLGAPTASWERATRTLYVAAETTAAGSADGDTVLALAVDGTDGAWRSATGDTQWMSAWITVGSAPARACASVRQRDVAGRWTEGAEACAAPEIIEETAGGCFSGRTPTMALLLGAFALTRKRR